VAISVSDGGVLLVVKYDGGKSKVLLYKHAAPGDG
jgi:hypothetical protein